MLATNSTVAAGHVAAGGDELARPSPAIWIGGSAPLPNSSRTAAAVPPTCAAPSPARSAANLWAEVGLGVNLALRQLTGEDDIAPLVGELGEPVHASAGEIGR